MKNDWDLLRHNNPRWQGEWAGVGQGLIAAGAGAGDSLYISVYFCEY